MSQSTRRATGTFQVTGWDEAPYDTLDGSGKLTRASVTGTFSGDLDGDATVEWLMAYADDEHATFVGVQKFTGSVHDRSGTFVVSMTGAFEGGVARASWTVVEGTGSGDLAGLAGEGSFEAPMGQEAAASLTYVLGGGQAGPSAM